MRTQINVDELLIRQFKRDWDNGVFCVFENDETRPPKSEYINFMSLMGSASNISIGRGKKTREFGTIIGEIRVKKHEGKGRAHELSIAFANIFMNKIIGGYISLFEASKEQVSTKSHYGINVSIPYQWDWNNGD